MISVQLTPEQFLEIAGRAPITDKSLRFMRLVFVDGCDVRTASDNVGVSPSRGYNMASDFKNMYNNWLAKNNVRPMIRFVRV